MKLTTVKLNILKKNRVYFQCKTENGYDVKLRINDASKDLSLGTHELLVEDASIRTKYGTDVIYIMHSEAGNEKIVLKSAYNEWLVEACKNLGGVWDREDKVWIFSTAVQKEVEDLDFIYNSELVTINLTAKRDVYACCGPITFLGYRLLTATGRDSGTKMEEGVAIISGERKSGGSRANWETQLSEGSILRLQIPKEVLNNNELKGDVDFSVELV